MTWQIFKRLLWKVWREDWLKWASVLLALVPVGNWIRSAYSTYESAWVINVLYLSAISALFGYNVAVRSAADRRELLKGHMTPLARPIWVYTASTLILCTVALVVSILTSATISELIGFPIEIVLPTTCALMPMITLALYHLGLWVDRWVVILIAILLPWVLASFPMLGISAKTENDNLRTYAIVSDIIPALINAYALCIIAIIWNSMLIMRSSERVQRVVGVTIISAICLVTILARPQIEEPPVITNGPAMTSQNWTVLVDSISNTWSANDTSSMAQYNIPLSTMTKIMALNDKGIAVGIKIGSSSADLKLWDIRRNAVSTLGSIDLALLGDYKAPPTDCDISKDQRYLLFCLPAKYGQGSDYVGYDIATHRSHLLLPNSPSELTIQPISGSKFAVTGSNVTRICIINAADTEAKSYQLSSSRGANQ